MSAKDGASSRSRSREREEVGFEQSQFDQIMGAIGGVKGEVTGVKTQLSGMAGQLNTLQGEMGTFKEETNEKFDQVRGSLDEHAKQIKELQTKTKEGGGGGSGGGGGGGASNPYSEPGWVRMGKRNTLSVGGFPRDTERDLIIAKLQEMSAPYAEGLAENGLYTTRKLTSFGKMKFKTSDDMWKFIKGNKIKQTFEDKDVYFSIDKTPEEISLSKKVSAGVKLLKDHYKENGTPEQDLKKLIDAEWNFV